MCHAYHTSQLLITQFTATPGSPLLTKIVPLGRGKDTVLYQVEWKPPNNVHQFDLDHYELVVGKETLYIERTQMSTIIPIFSGSVNTTLSISLCIVSTCGKKSFTNQFFSIHDENSSDSHIGSQGSQISTKKLIAFTSILSLVVVVLSVVVLLLCCMIGNRRKRSPSDGDIHDSKYTN